MQEIEQRDRELLAVLQSEVPLVSTPYAVIGQQIDMSEKEIAGVFEPRALGYRTCLVAARMAEERLDAAASVISAHPGVSQNYRRNHEFNIWFTLNISPTSRLGLDRTIEILGELSEAAAIRALPTLKLYKAANHELPDNQAVDAEHPHGDEAVPVLDRVEIEAIRLLQNDLPLQPRPFDVLSRAAGTVPPDDLLAVARTMVKRQQLRRIAATVQPRKTGFAATAMAVWSVPQDQVDSCGARISAHRSVSHCYLRPVYEDWPYNLFTTVHGRSVDECDAVIRDLAAENGLRDGRALYPTREFKRERIHLFAPELEAWEAAHLGGSDVESAVS
jgi:siroheme decarboxylase